MLLRVSPSQFCRLIHCGNHLILLQIRPFNESRQAQASAYLARMDQALEKNMDRTVNLREAIK